MLRLTNRLDQYLASKGQGVYAPGKRDEYKEIIFREAEFVESLLEDGRCPLLAPPKFDFSKLDRLNKDAPYNGYCFRDGRGRDSPSTLPDTGVALSEGETFDILWLSTTEFLSRFRLRECTWVVELYCVVVTVNEERLKFHVYRLMECTDNNYRSVWNLEVDPPAEYPLRFMAHLLAPVLDTIQRVTLDFRTKPPVEATLMLVPSTTCNLSKAISILLGSPTHDLLRALASHPVHPRVLLRLHDEHISGISAPEMNDHLLEFRNPVHLQIPYDLLTFNDCEESFAANPFFHSLTINANAGMRLSPKLLDAMAGNTGLKHVTVDTADFLSDDIISSPELIVDLLCNVVQQTSTLESMTVEIHYDYIYSTSEPFIDLQGAFDGLAQYCGTNSKRTHGLSKWQWTFRHHHGHKSFAKSNALWDSQFSPALLLNCLRRQPGGCPTARVSGLAIQSVNEGLLYSHATNVAPWDRSASSATAIFEIIRDAAMSTKDSRVELDFGTYVFGGCSELSEIVMQTKLDLDEFVATRKRLSYSHRAEWVKLGKCFDLCLLFSRQTLASLWFAFIFVAPNDCPHDLFLFAPNLDRQTNKLLKRLPH
jgi:hypothetical protein